MDWAFDQIADVLREVDGCMRIVSVASAIPEQQHRPTLRSKLGWGWNRDGLNGEPEFFDVRRQRQRRPRRISRYRLPPHAIRNSGIHGRDIGLVLLATSTPDHLLPPTAPLVAHRLGLQAGAIDLVGACSGFLYALVLGSHWADAAGKAALVIGANILTRRVNQNDPATVSLFSDGAGAALCRSVATDMLF